MQDLNESELEPQAKDPLSFTDASLVFAFCRAREAVVTVSQKTINLRMDFLFLLLLAFKMYTSSTPPLVSDPDAWFQDRFWALSGNRIAKSLNGDAAAISTKSSRIYQPTFYSQVADIVKSTSADSIPVAVVSG